MQALGSLYLFHKRVESVHIWDFQSKSLTHGSSSSKAHTAKQFLYSLFDTLASSGRSFSEVSGDEVNVCFICFSYC